jgi:hypothetical protein
MLESLSRTDGNQGVAAGLLGLSRQRLNERLRGGQPPGRTAEPAAWPVWGQSVATLACARSLGRWDIGCTVNACGAALGP